MYPSWMSEASFYEWLERIDGELAETARAEGCGCGGVLHQATYPRKGRGGPQELGAGYDRRLSFCCARRDCRQRCTPPSVRFLGRRVYLGAVVVLVSAMLAGPTPRRVATLVDVLGVSRRTLERWRKWWRTTFAESVFWKAAAGRFARPPARTHLPQSLLERFEGDERERLVAALRFLGPITTTGAGCAMA
ncbi:MAG: hypothetical protein ACREQQ_05835 [Candidatus Binatia bacterium]